MWFFDFLSENGNILEEKNLWRPQSPDIKINLEYIDVKLRQAWEYEWNWYYNYLWALNEVKYLGKKLPSKEDFEKINKQKTNDTYIDVRQLIETLRINWQISPLTWIMKNKNQLMNILPANGIYNHNWNKMKGDLWCYWCGSSKSTYSWNIYEELYKLSQESESDSPCVFFGKSEYSIIPLEILSFWLSVRCLKN